MLAESCQGASAFGQGDGAGAHAMGDGASRLAVDFDGDGTLEEADGDDQAVNLVGVGDDALQTRQRAALDVYLRSDAEGGPRLRCKPRAQDDPNCLDLVEVNGGGGLAGTDDADHAGRGEDGHEAIADVEPVEQIAGEERELYFFDPVGPPPPGAIERKELFVALAAQGGGGEACQSGLDSKSVPRQLAGR